MGESLGFVVETLVALLLLVTIGYCVLVNRKLEQLRSDQSELRQIVRELNAATGHAEAAISGLRENAKSAEQTLAVQMQTAGDLGTRLAGQIAKGEALLSKLTLLTHAPRESVPAPIREQLSQRNIRASSIGLGLLNAQQRSQKPANRGAA